MHTGLVIIGVKAPLRGCEFESVHIIIDGKIVVNVLVANALCWR